MLGLVRQWEPLETITSYLSVKYSQRYRRDGATSKHDRSTPMGDQRFNELLSQAGAFFASSEIDPAVEKARVIAEIHQQMAAHGLTVSDLVD